MAFPTTSVLDTFTRANGNIGGNWSAPEYAGGSTPPQISGNQLTGSGANYCDAYINNITPGPDVEAFVTIPTRGANGDELYIDVRIQSPNSASLSCYQLWLLFGTSTVTWSILRITSGGSVSTSLATEVTQQVSNGDTVGIEVTGTTTTTVRGLRKPSGGSWAQVISGTDSSSPIVSSGRIAIGVKGTTIKLDDYGGGTVTSGLQSATLGIVSEIDSIFSIGRTKSKTLGLLSEVDSLLTLSNRKLKTIGWLNEVNTSQSIGRNKNLSIGLLLESDNILSLIQKKSSGLGLLIEDDTLYPLDISSSQILGFLIETDSLLPVERKKTKILGLLTENGILSPVLDKKSLVLSLLEELDITNSLSKRKTITLGFLEEQDQILSLIVDSNDSIVGSIVMTMDDYEIVMSELDYKISLNDKEYQIILTEEP